MPDATAPLDGCELDFADPAHVTGDGEQTLALVLFADCWDDSAVVERRRVELLEWDVATRHPREQA